MMKISLHVPKLDFLKVQRLQIGNLFLSQNIIVISKWLLRKPRSRKETKMISFTSKYTEFKMTNEKKFIPLVQPFCKFPNGEKMFLLSSFKVLLTNYMFKFSIKLNPRKLGSTIQLFMMSFKSLICS